MPPALAHVRRWGRPWYDNVSCRCSHAMWVARRPTSHQQGQWMTGHPRRRAGGSGPQHGAATHGPRSPSELRPLAELGLCALGSGSVQPHAREAELRRGLAAASEAMRSLGDRTTAQVRVERRTMNGRTLADVDNAVEGGMHEMAHDSAWDDLVLPTVEEEREAAAMATLLHWVSTVAVTVPRARFTAQRHGLLRALEGVLLPNQDTTDANRFSTCPRLHESLARRAAATYMELLVELRLGPPGVREWEQLCCTLTLARAGPHPIARLPLFPSGLYLDPWRRAGSEERGVVGRHQAETAEASAELELLARTLSSQQARAILDWALLHRKRDERHLSSEDVLFVIHRLVQDTSNRDDDGDEGKGSGAALPDELKLLWERSRAAEREDRVLARACGLDRTVADTISLDGERILLHASSDAQRSSGGDGAALTDIATFHELILQGDWRSVLAIILERAQAHPHAAPAAFDDAEDTSRVNHLLRDALSGTAQRVARPMEILKTFFAAEGERVPVPLFANPRHALSYQMPSRYATASVTQSEVALLASSLGSSGTGVVGQAREGCLLAAADLVGPTNATADGEPHEQVEAFLRAQKRHETRAGRSPHAPPSSVVELRRRLWLLSQLPPHLSKALVRFDRNSRGSGTTASPCLCRSPQREFLPWLLVRAVGLAVEASLCDMGKTTRDVDELLEELRAAVAPTLFTPAADYASFHDYTCDLFLHMGTMAADLAVERFRPPHATTAAADKCVALAEATVFRCAVLLFCPPTSLLGPTASPQARVCCAVNYMSSLYLGLVAQLAPSLADVADLFASAASDGGVVLGPETAAVITTSLVLRLAPIVAARRCHDDDEEAAAAQSSDLVHALAKAVAPLSSLSRSGRLLFVVPTNKIHAVASYFRGIYDPSYVGAESGEAVWHGSWKGPEALLVGRSLRLVSRHPATTTDAFLRGPLVSRGRDVGGAHFPFTQDIAAAPPPLSMQLFAVDVAKAIDFFAGRATEQWTRSRNAGGGDGCGDVVACGNGALPRGLCAVYKPAGVTTTLHAGHDSLVLVLSQRLPWAGEGPPPPSLPPPLSSADSPSSLVGVTRHILRGAVSPVRHQHGLVNRIDVGTSGLVLAATDRHGLHVGRLLTLSHHRVRKTYRAFVQHCSPTPRGPPLPTGGRGHRHDIATFLPTASSVGGGVAGAVPVPVPVSPRLWYLPSRGLVSSTVAAAGGDVTSVAVSAPAAALAAAATPGKAAAALDQRPALTHYRVLEHFPKASVSFVELVLSSGRRHQVRQHMAQLQHPLLGDSRYHPAYVDRPAPRRATRPPRSVEDLFTRPALHASGLDIITIDEAGAEGGRVLIDCPLPSDMRQALYWLRRGEREMAKQRHSAPWKPR